MSFTCDKESDNYTTDEWCWELIRDIIPKNKIIWSPFFNEGKMKEYFNNMDFDIIHEDKDFFSYTPQYDLLIDNPPFSKFPEVCDRLKDLDKPFILLSPCRPFLTKKFQNRFKEHLQIIIPNKRLTFTHLDNGNKKYSPPYGAWFFCYKMNLPKDLMWI